MPETRRVTATMLLRSVLSLVGFVLFLGVALFLPAGDIRWANGWLFIAVFTALTIPSIAYLWRVNPDIFVARSKIHEGTKRWDKVLVLFLLLAFFAIFPLAGLDARFHGSAVPVWLVALGYLLTTVGYIGSVWVYATNKFAEPTVRVQTERGQTVVSTGPYAIVRHPLYLWSLFLFPGFPLALGSYWALAPAVLQPSSSWCGPPWRTVRSRRSWKGTRNTPAASDTGCSRASGKAIHRIPTVPLCPLRRRRNGALGCRPASPACTAPPAFPIPRPPVASFCLP